MCWFQLPENAARRCAEFLAGRKDAGGAVKECLRLSRAEILKAHLGGAPGGAVCAAISAAVDESVKFLWNGFLEKRLRKDGRIGGKACIAAIGGYGRSELSPNSDIDILFLYEDGVGDGIKELLVDGVMYPLWDTGVKLGHRARPRAKFSSAPQKTRF